MPSSVSGKVIVMHVPLPTSLVAERATAVRFGQLLHDREADAAPAFARPHRGRSLLEPSEEPRHRFRRDAHARVLHVDAHGLVRDGQPDVDPSVLRRELGRVRDEVRDHPLEPRAIDRALEGVGPFVGDRDPTLVARGLPGGHHLFDRLRDVGHALLELELSLLSRREQEEPVDEVEQPAHVRLDGPERLPAARGHVRRVRQLRRGEPHERERAPDLVADVREEAIARQLRFLQALVRDAQLIVGGLQLGGAFDDAQLEVLPRFLELDVAGDEVAVRVLERVRDALRAERPRDRLLELVEPAVPFRHHDLVANAPRDGRHRQGRRCVTDESRKVLVRAARHEEERLRQGIPVGERHLDRDLVAPERFAGRDDAREQLVPCGPRVADDHVEVARAEQEPARRGEGFDQPVREEGAPHGDELVVAEERSRVLHDARVLRPGNASIGVLEIPGRQIGPGDQVLERDVARRGRAHEDVERPAGHLAHRRGLYSGREARDQVRQRNTRLE